MCRKLADTEIHHIVDKSDQQQSKIFPQVGEVCGSKRGLPQRSCLFFSAVETPTNGEAPGLFFLTPKNHDVHLLTAMVKYTFTKP